MAIVEMTRGQVVQAIESEKLTYGMWAHGGGVYGDEQDDAEPAGKSCSFCAVGATVRAAMSTSTAFGVVHDTAESLGWDHDDLHRLSETFESAVADASAVATPSDWLEAGRAAAIAYVQSPDFPDVIRIDIGDAKPRDGMKVVQS